MHFRRINPPSCPLTQNTPRNQTSLHLHLQHDCTNLRPQSRGRMVYDACSSEGETGDVEMSGTVYIIGAGASAGYGAPTFSNFFDKAKQIMEGDSADVDKDRFRTVIDTHRKPRFSSYNIEQFYNFLETEAILEDPTRGNWASELKDATLYLISATIKHSLEDETPKDISNFIKNLEHKTNVTIINLNWDLLFDSYFFGHYMKINYGYASHDLDDANDNKHKPVSSLKMLKLHGSLNWLVCSECNKKIFFVRRYIIDGKEYDNCCCMDCGDQPLERLILPPVSAKLGEDSKYELIKEIWRLARVNLIEAERIYIIGYSFPPTDSQFENFFKSSLSMNKNLEEVIIVTYPKYGQEKMEFEGRYASIFRHTGHDDKINFKYHSFEKYIKIKDDGRYRYLQREPVIKAIR